MSAVDLWHGQFGDEYTQRNRGEASSRYPFWLAMAPYIGNDIYSVLEVGANTGLNLEALADLRDEAAAIFPQMSVENIKLYANEPNDMARAELKKNLDLPPERLCAHLAHNLKFQTDSIDLVFTSGVLIHVEPHLLLRSMEAIHRVAKKYIVCAEYFAPQEEMIPYRGHDNAMWRRDYGSLYLDNFKDLECLGVGFLWKRACGLDNLTMWIFEKKAKDHGETHYESPKGYTH